MKPKEFAIKLRKQGYSYNYISDKTGLAKSTLSYHLARIPYSPNKHSQQVLGKARAVSAQSKAKAKQTSITDAAIRAQKHLKNLTERDILMLGIGLYIGEGSKTQDAVRLVNADPRVIQLYINWLRALNVPLKHIFIRLHIYPDVDEQRAKVFWSKQTGIPLNQFDRSCVDIRKNKNRLRHKTIQYGTAHVSVKALGKPEFGVKLGRLIGAYMEKVLR